MKESRICWYTFKGNGKSNKR